MNKKPFRRMYSRFVLFVFLIMLSSTIIMTPIAIIAVKMHFIKLGGTQQSFVFPLLVLMAASLIMGAFLATLIGGKILFPILKLIEATKEVTDGNYDIQLDTKASGDVGDLIQSFNRMTKELSNIEIFRNDFVVNVSHEFKTPLVAIQGYATLLQDEDLTVEERREYAQMLLEGTHRLSVLSSNILKLSKLDTQEAMVERGRFALDEQIREAFLLLETQWSEKDMTLNIELEPAQFMGNEELLMQVWLNLLGNAIKYSYEKGMITVTLRSDDSSHIITIADEGIGMTLEVQEHIFDKFFQGDTTHSSEGNGLGLALVKRIVDLSSGIINVSSKPNEGSIFTVALPRK